MEINLPQPKVVFNEHRKIATFRLDDRTVAHRIIEELMLLANENTAEFLLEHALPGLYRNHNKPDTNKLQALAPVLMHHNIALDVKKVTPHVLQSVLLHIEKSDHKAVLIPLVLSTMAQANYSAENNGHFGLAYRHYCHFTSPIRRYPDLLVHRAITSFLSTGKPKRVRTSYLNSIAKHASLAERRADEASRYALNWLKCDFMALRVGERFGGAFPLAGSFGVFVVLDDVHIDGLVHVSQFSNDYYDFDADLLTLRGRETGREYAMGARVYVEVASVDQIENLVDFRFVDG